MDIGFSEEQELLRETARKFLDSECDSRFVRERMADRGGGDRRILATARRARLARDRLSRGRWRQRAWARRSRRVDGGDGAAGHAGPVSVDGVARRRRRSPRPARRRSAANGCRGSPPARPRRRSPGPSPTLRWDAAGDRAAGARNERRLHPLRQQAVCRRRASRRHPGGRRAHPRRQHDGGRRQPVPGAEGHPGPHRRADADDRRDPQIVRGAARQRRVAGVGAARREARGLGAVVAGHRRARPWRCAPRCAAARSRCST